MLTVAGTGYTGEDGVELAVPAAHAEALWAAVTAAGIVPAGLGARDTLRLEAGLPLHGHELGPGITTLQANLGWVVAWEKGPFRGREVLLAEREAGPRRRLRGLVTDGRRPPREGSVVRKDGVPRSARSPAATSPPSSATAWPSRSFPPTRSRATSSSSTSAAPSCRRAWCRCPFVKKR